ncbi:MAG: glycosyltransferase family 2 protein [Rhodocyclaceae bacterium]|nr:glycosyltransferase family 2 protein [Rhodocyclaceae bacterium]
MSLAASVIIVNYNGGEYVLRCLAALRAQTRRDFALIVVDNASSDGSCERLAALYPEARLIAARRNLGFAGAVNLALKEIDTPWFALLNPDAFPDADWLANLLTAAQCASGDVAAFGSQLLSYANPQRLDGIGDAYHVSGLPWRIGHGRIKCLRDEMPREIFSPCAAAALYRTEAVRAVGGFDEALFCYLEDVDLGFRLRLTGHRCFYVPSARVAHIGSAITGRRSDFQIYHGHRNVVRVFVKNMPSVLFWLFLPAHLAMNLITLLTLAWKGHGNAVWRAKRDALRDLPKAWRARQATQRLRCAPFVSLLAQFTWLPRR